MLNKEFQGSYELMHLRLANGKYLNLFRRRAETHAVAATNPTREKNRPQVPAGRSAQATTSKISSAPVIPLPRHGA